MLGCCAVIGHPLSHSLSPVIHQAFAAQFGEDLDYAKLDVVEADFEARVEQFFTSGGLGLNVTLPFKEHAFRLTDLADELATAASAVNTLFLRGGHLCGSNTDGIGLVRDLTKELNIQLKGKSVLIVGAGGAARGLVVPLLRAGVVEINLANRTPARAEQLVREMAGQAGANQRLRFSGLRDFSGPQPDLVINATAAGMDAALPEISPAWISGSVCYDLMYGAKANRFCHWAQEKGARDVFTGLGMLVCQAAESFFIWHGLRPDASVVLRQLKQSQRNLS